MLYQISMNDEAQQLVVAPVDYIDYALGNCAWYDTTHDVYYGAQAGSLSTATHEQKEVIIRLCIAKRIHFHAYN